MPEPRQPDIVEKPELHDKTHIFRDRRHAGTVLAEMLGEYRDTGAVVLGIPAGGIPVAAEIAQMLKLPLDVAVVSKITLPWNTEAGYGAVAFDGSFKLNSALLGQLNLSDETIQDGIARTREKVGRRVQLFRGNQPLPSFADRPVILVDDGLASGFTMLVAIEALRNASVSELIVAAPTGHSSSVDRIGREADGVFCANIRSGYSFAVASAYENWYDVDENEVLKLLTWVRETQHPVA